MEVVDCLNISKDLIQIVMVNHKIERGLSSLPQRRLFERFG